MLRFNDDSGSVVLRSATCAAVPPNYYCGFRAAGVLGNFGLDGGLTPRTTPCSADASTTAGGSHGS